MVWKAIAYLFLIRYDGEYFLFKRLETVYDWSIEEIYIKSVKYYAYLCYFFGEENY